MCRGSKKYGQKSGGERGGIILFHQYTAEIPLQLAIAEALIGVDG